MMPRRPRLRRHSGSLVTTLVAASFPLVLAGCIGASATGGLIGVLLLVTALTLQACIDESPKPGDTTSGEVNDTTGSDTTPTDTTPTDTTPTDTTPTDTTPTDTGPDTSDATQCDGNWESACQDGQIVQLCCPAGLACNYGMLLVDCGEGTCVERPATCPTEPTCDGNWESACQDGEVVQLCCPEGMACNYGQLMVRCGDDTCVNMPDTCPTEPTCDGNWESACVDNRVTQLCCPDGMACNYGQLMVLCGDDTCVNMPETCAADE